MDGWIMDGYWMKTPTFANVREVPLFREVMGSVRVAPFLVSVISVFRIVVKHFYYQHLRRFGDTQSRQKMFAHVCD